MSKELENLIGQRFIQRTDVKAIQRGDIYMPHTDSGKRDGNRIGWNRQAIRDHIEGRVSYGHYLVDTDGMSKLFAFDIDLVKSEPEKGKTFHWIGIEPDGTWSDMEPREVNPREAWSHPKCPDNLKRYLTSQLLGTAHVLAQWTAELIEIPVAVAYSGSKGVHVYGLTGSARAEDCRDAAIEVIEMQGKFETIRGRCFYGPVDKGVKSMSSCVEVEVFPKQTDLDGKDLGNLMRLPLGVNAKGGRSFFVTLSSNVDEMQEVDPVRALEGGNPWQQ